MQVLVFFLLMPLLLSAQVPRCKADIEKGSIASWCAWAFFGNDDDGIYGEKPSAGNWSKEPIGEKRAIKWWLRNPMHNFTFYVIGTADRQNSEFILLSLGDRDLSFLTYRKRARTTFAGNGSSLFLGFHGWKPFLSLRLDYGRRLDFYFGWRERGNFGIKFNPSAKSLLPPKRKCYAHCHHHLRTIGHGNKKKI